MHVCSHSSASAYVATGWMRSSVRSSLQRKTIWREHGNKGDAGKSGAKGGAECVCVCVRLQVRLRRARVEEWGGGGGEGGRGG